MILNFQIRRVRCKEGKDMPRVTQLWLHDGWACPCIYICLSQGQFPKPAPWGLPMASDARKWGCRLSSTIRKNQEVHIPGWITLKDKEKGLLHASPWGIAETHTISTAWTNRSIWLKWSKYSFYYCTKVRKNTRERSSGKNSRQLMSHQKRKAQEETLTHTLAFPLVITVQGWPIAPSGVKFRHSSRAFSPNKGWVPEVCWGHLLCVWIPSIPAFCWWVGRIADMKNDLLMKHVLSYLRSGSSCCWTLTLLSTLYKKRSKSYKTRYAGRTWGKRYSSSQLLMSLNTKGNREDFALPEWANFKIQRLPP